MSIYQITMAIIVFGALIFSFIMGFKHSYDDTSKWKSIRKIRIKSSQSQDNDFDLREVLIDNVTIVNKEILDYRSE